MNNEPDSQHSPSDRPRVGTVSWLSHALRILKRAPQVWLLAGGVMMIAFLASFALDWFGQVVLSLLTPVFVGALIQGCSVSDAGLPMTPQTVVSTFSNTDLVKRLLLLSCFLLVFQVILAGITFGLFLATGGSEVLQELHRYIGQNASQQERAALAPQLVPLMILVMMNIFIYLAANFFSIPLVTLKNTEPFKALLLSIVSTFKYLFPIIGVCLAVFAVTIVASAILRRADLVLVFMLVVVWPLMICIQYVAYDSVFGNDEASPPKDPGSNDPEPPTDDTLKA